MHQIDQIEIETDFESNSSSDMSPDDDDVECDQITPTVITGKDFYGSKQFIYHEEVDVTITNCSFYGSIEFIFYGDASIKFEKNNCYESAFFKGFGKFQTKFIKCDFYGSKKVIFQGNSSLNCEDNNFYGSVSYEGLSELHPEFQGCNFFASKKCFDAFTNYSITTQNESNAKPFNFKPFFKEANEMFKSVCTLSKEKISKLQNIFELSEVNPKTNLSDRKTNSEENRLYNKEKVDIIIGHILGGLLLLSFAYLLSLLTDL